MAGFGDAFVGGLGGGLGGGAVGGPAGALIGGAGGFLGGLFGGSGEDPQLVEARKRLLALGGQGLGPAAQAGMSDLRPRQVNYLDQVQALAEGRGPSLATELMKDSMNRAEGSQNATAARAVGAGSGAGGAYRQAGANVAAMQSQAGRDTGMMRAQEQLNALSQLGQGIYGARGQDESLNTFNTQQTNQMNSMGRMYQLQALQSLMQGKNAKTGPSLGESIGAGGAKLFGLMGGM